MAVSNNNILDVLREYRFHSLEDEAYEIDLPGIGQIEEGESVYVTSIDEVFGGGDLREGLSPEGAELEGPRICPRMWERSEVLERISAVSNSSSASRDPRRVNQPPEPHRACYCPIHFFGHDWGIYIREECILSHAIEIATFVDWSYVRLRWGEIKRDLPRGSLYVFFLHEQFHHTVESLGLRLLVSNGADRYRTYKVNVHSPTLLKPDCIEESLANAESRRRLSEGRYVKRLDPEILEAQRRHLKWSLPKQPPGDIVQAHGSVEAANLSREETAAYARRRLALGFGPPRLQRGGPVSGSAVRSRRADP